MTTPSAAPPIVALLGRPNVGKSTLFNRFAGHRRALVDDVPGVTRDRIAEEVEVGDRTILLVDTAGLDPDAEDGLQGAVQSQARVAVAEADAILLVVDGRAGLLPEDAEIARLLRRAKKPTLLLANKLDQPQHEMLAAEFHALGLDVRAVSGEHGRGAWDALEEVVAALPPAPDAPAPAPSDALHLAIVGRPNVGKSSLVNRLVGVDRMVVSDEPGTTRDAVDVALETPGGRVVLVDTAGLRRPGRRNLLAERGSALMAVRALERADVALVVFDAGEGLRDQDVRVAALARERGRPVLLVANKWDLLAEQGEGAAARLREEVARRLRFMPDAPLLGVSALRGTRVDRLVPAARGLYDTATVQVETAALNRWLAETVARHEPSMAQKGPRRRPIKFFYATQTDIAPPTFVLFCTEPRAIQPSYRRYLEKQLRERFDLAGTPIRLRLRARGGSA